MPAIDRYQTQFINALKKSGWMVIENPHSLRIGKRSIFVDLLAERNNEDQPKQVIIIEVKSFEDKSAVRNLEEAIG